MCVISHSVMSNSLWPYECSPPGYSALGDSPDKNTGVGCHALLQGILPTQGLNWGLLHHMLILYQLSYQGSPTISIYLSAVCSTTQSCPTLCDPMGCNPLNSLSMEFFQARILEWAAISYSRGSFDPGMEPASLACPELAGRFLTTSATWEAHICICLCI